MATSNKRRFLRAKKFGFGPVSYLKDHPEGRITSQGAKPQLGKGRYLATFAGKRLFKTTYRKGTFNKTPHNLTRVIVGK